MDALVNGYLRGLLTFCGHLEDFLGGFLGYGFYFDIYLDCSVIFLFLVKVKKIARFDALGNFFFY